MGCSACRNKIAVANAGEMVQRNYRVAEPVGPCDYTNEQLTIWADKLKWFKDKGLHVKYNYKPALINKYLGIVLTSININNKCVYKTDLDTMAALILFITSLQ